MGIVSTMPYPPPAGTYNDEREKKPRKPKLLSLRESEAEEPVGPMDSLAHTRAVADMARARQQQEVEARQLQQMTAPPLSEGLPSVPAEREILNPREWLQRNYPNLIGTKIRRSQDEALGKQYTQYVATQHLLTRGDLDRTSAETEIAKLRMASRPRPPGDFQEAALGGDPYARQMLDRMHPPPTEKPPGSLEEMAARSAFAQLSETGTIDRNDPAIQLWELSRKTTKDGGPKDLEELLVSSIQGGKTAGIEFDLYRERYGKEPKPVDPEKQLGADAIAELRAQAGSPAEAMGRFKALGREDKPSSLLDRPRLSEQLYGVGGFGGLINAAKADPVKGYGDLYNAARNNASMTGDPNEQRMLMDLVVQNRPPADAIFKAVGLNRKKATQADIDRVYSSGRLGAVGSTPAKELAGIMSMAIADQQ